MILRNVTAAVARYLYPLAAAVQTRGRNASPPFVLPQQQPHPRPHRACIGLQSRPCNPGRHPNKQQHISSQPTRDGPRANMCQYRRPRRPLHRPQSFASKRRSAVRRAAAPCLRPPCLGSSPKPPYPHPLVSGHAQARAAWHLCFGDEPLPQFGSAVEWSAWVAKERRIAALEAEQLVATGQV